VTTRGDQDPTRARPGATTIDLAIRLGFVVLLGYLSFRVIAPFATIGVWSAILAVALYPLFDRLARWLAPRLPAAVITVLCLMIVLGPVTWLGLGMIGGIRALATGLSDGQLPIPQPPQSVKGWPIVGERLYQLWSLATTNAKVALAEALPMLKPFSGTLLGIAQSALHALLELLVSIVIAGFLFTRGPQLVDALGTFLSRVLRQHGRELVQLAGATIRNVSRGVVGIAFLQALLAAAGFLAAGVPAPGVLAFLALLLGIVQIGPLVVFIPTIIWSWSAMETTHALIFTAYMILVGLVDIGGVLNVLDRESLVKRLGVQRADLGPLDEGPVVRASGDGLLEDGGVRGQPPQAILLDQAVQFAADNQVAPDVVEPHRLAKDLQRTQRIFESRHLGEASPIPRLAGEASVQERADQLPGKLGADDAAAQHQHVHVIVLDALVRRVGVMAKSGTNPGYPVGGHRCANPASAEENAALRLVLAQGLADRLRVIGIVHRIGAIGAQVENLAMLLGQESLHRFLQCESRMVRAYGDAHRLPPLSLSPPSVNR
jgi:predicted PurR-regulated permease PerM